MMQKRWFKIIIWFVATTIFFLASSVLISSLGPEPSEQQIMSFMSGMMSSMSNSMMGLSMSLENEGELKSLIGTAAAVTIPLVLIAVLFGLLLRAGMHGEQRNEVERPAGMHGEQCSEAERPARRKKDA